MPSKKSVPSSVPFLRLVTYFHCPTTKTSKECRTLREKLIYHRLKDEVNANVHPRTHLYTDGDRIKGASTTTKEAM